MCIQPAQSPLGNIKNRTRHLPHWRCHHYSFIVLAIFRWHRLSGSRSCPAAGNRCIKKRAHFSFPCTQQKPDQRPKSNTQRKRMRPYGRISTHMPFDFEMLGRISAERLVSVDANSRLGGFLPAAPKLHGFGICLPPQNAAYYTTTRRQKTNPRQKSSARAVGSRPSATSYFSGFLAGINFRR